MREAQSIEIRDLMKEIIDHIPELVRLGMDEKIIRKSISEIRYWISNTGMVTPLLGDVHQAMFNYSPYSAFRLLSDKRAPEVNKINYGMKKIEAVFSAFYDWTPKTVPEIKVNPDVARAAYDENLTPKPFKPKPERTEASRQRARDDRKRRDKIRDRESKERKKKMDIAIQELERE